jgi:hypothetical protein
MIVYDFFSGTGSSTKAFEDAGHTIMNVEMDEYFEAHERDILQLTASDLIAKYGKPDFIWASPPCTSFSIAAISHHRNKDCSPKSEAAHMGDLLLLQTIKLINDLQPEYWVLENPRGMMRNHPALSQMHRRTVTYCQYGDTRMKPTDLWSNITQWVSKPICKNGDSCHEAAPRGSRTGTQGLKNAKIKSMIPYELGKEILNAITKQ